MLHQLINQHFENVDQINPTLDMGKHSKADKHKEKESQSFRESSFSKWVCRFAPPAFNSSFAQQTIAINTFVKTHHKEFFLVNGNPEFNSFISEISRHPKKEAQS